MICNDRLCKAARALLDWTAEDLAREAQLGVATVRRFETGADVRIDTTKIIQAALERAGIQFIEAGSIMRPGRSNQGAGVRMRES
jgi:predicted transcriptional regulator